MNRLFALKNSHLARLRHPDLGVSSVGLRNLVCEDILPLPTRSSRPSGGDRGRSRLFASQGSRIAIPHSKVRSRCPRQPPVAGSSAEEHHTRQLWISNAGHVACTEVLRFGYLFPEKIWGWFLASLISEAV